MSSAANSLTAEDQAAVLDKIAARKPRGANGVRGGESKPQSLADRLQVARDKRAGKGRRVPPAEVLADRSGEDLTPLVQSFSAPAAGIAMLPWSSIDRSPLNPRKHFDPEPLAELAANIAEVGGVKQNLQVRARADALRAGVDRVHWADRKYGWPHKIYVDGMPNRYAGLPEVRGCTGGPLIDPADPRKGRGPDIPGPSRPAPARETNVKFYTIHLLDATPEEKDLIERAMGLRFEFLDNGNVRWTPYPYPPTVTDGLVVLP